MLGLGNTMCAHGGQGVVWDRRGGGGLVYSWKECFAATFPGHLRGPAGRRHITARRSATPPTAPPSVAPPGRTLAAAAPGRCRPLPAAWSAGDLETARLPARPACCGLASVRRRRRRPAGCAGSPLLLFPKPTSLAPGVSARGSSRGLEAWQGCGRDALCPAELPDP